MQVWKEERQWAHTEFIIYKLDTSEGAKGVCIILYLVFNTYNNKSHTAWFLYTLQVYNQLPHKSH